MLISEMISRINKQLAGERLTTAQMMTYIDATIDDINQAMNADFPIVSTYAAEQINLGNYETVETVDYHVFPDRYIRTVLVLGAARHFYLVDEEGISSAPALDAEYGKNLFMMQRDYIHAIPTEYKDCSYNGSIQFSESAAVGTEVLSLPVNFGNFWGE